jgi:hypothetical protein
MTSRGGQFLVSSGGQFFTSPDIDPVNLAVMGFGIALAAALPFIF